MQSKRINHHMISLARESRGLSQSDLAKRLNVTQGKISKIESGLLNPTDEMISELRNILSYPESFFYQSQNIYSLGMSFYRKHKTLTKSIQVYTNANINIERIQIQKLLNSVQLSNKIEHIEIDKSKNMGPEKIARLVRKLWNVKRGPIENLTKLLEEAGIIVVFTDLGTSKFSGVSVLSENGTYIIFVNSNMPSDRIRFTLAHELGHIIMHRQSQSESMEPEADLFASEFLMPSEDISHQLYKLSLEKLANLKVYWKVSMQAILKRAEQLGKITERYARYLWMQMGKYGYRTNEPSQFNIPIEKPTLLAEIIQVHLTELGFSMKDLSEFLCCIYEEFKNKYYPEVQNPKLKLVKA